MIDAMIDLETMDTTPTSVILSIGVQMFDPVKGKLGPALYCRLDRHTQPGRTSSEDTMEWWSKQSAGARQEAFGGIVPLPKALDALKGFLPDNCIVWGNGPHFDISILEDAYDVSPPWEYNAVKCMRTIVGLAPELRKDIVRSGTHHKALDDATHQAKVVNHIYAKRLNGLWNGLWYTVCRFFK